jgi:hypothetical protein
VGTLIGSAAAGGGAGLPVVASLLTALPTGSLPIVGDLLTALPLDSLPLVGDLLGLLGI